MSKQPAIPAPTTIKYKGKTFVVTPLSARDLVEHAAHLRESYMNDAKVQMKGLPLELAKYAWSEAKAEADKIHPVTDEYRAASQSFAGQVYMFWLSIRKAQPAFTYEEAEEALTEQFAELSEKANAAAGFEVPDDGDVPLAPAEVVE